MTDYETGAVRDTGGKGRMDLLPMCALIRISRHMEDALTHYPERNWEKGLPLHTMIDSAFRHLAKYVDGQSDEDHLCAAATNLLMALWTEEKKPEMLDIGPHRASCVVNNITGSVKVEEFATTLCECFHHEHGKDVCWGTKEVEVCHCDGNVTKCTFYPEKRAAVIKNEKQG